MVSGRVGAHALQLRIPASILRLVRPARPEEIAELELRRGLDDARGEDLKYCFAFLVPIDAGLN